MNTKATELDRLREQCVLPVRPSGLRERVEEIARNSEHEDVEDVLRMLEDEGVLREHRLVAENGRTSVLYSSGSLEGLDLYVVAHAMFPEGYFCNFSAVYYHGLTDQVPKAVYVCHETISKRARRKRVSLSDQRVRSAFVKPHRHTRYVFEMRVGRVVVVDREIGSDHGVARVKGKAGPLPGGARVTSVERTLMDAVVAPQYNGGIVSVCGYFRAARGQVQAAKLIKLYKQMDYIYPYAQAMGFLLENAGMKAAARKMYEAFPPKRDFYIDHDAKTSWQYDEHWRLYYPAGLTNDY
jgi:predicted transcriptional regulator of viral defense system